MNSQDKLAGKIEDPVLEQTLRHFKESVDAWSEAAYSRPRTVVLQARHGWRRSAAWALGCLLALVCIGGGVYQRFHSQDVATTAALKSAEQKAAKERLARVEKLAATEKSLEQKAAAQSSSTAAPSADENDDLLATLDNDVSREVPAAMEPLAQLMDDSGAKENGTK